MALKRGRLDWVAWARSITKSSHCYRNAQIIVAMHKCCLYERHALERARQAVLQLMDNAVNQVFGMQAFGQTEKLFKDALVPENIQAIAQQGVAVSKDLYAKTAAAAQDGARAITDIADTAWGSTKMLNEKIVQNVTANADVAFSAAQAMANARSVPEIVKLQGEFVQKLAAQATEQTREFFDLSARATQHIIEIAQAAAARSFKPAP
jgi:phasin family protein